MTEIYKSYTVRLYPTKEQEIMFWKHIGSCRYIWNYMLNLQEERFKNGEKHLSAFDMIYLLKPLKKQPDLTWLKECSNSSYSIVCRDLDKAYSKFFKKICKRPRFKSKKSAKKTYPVCNELLFARDAKFMHIQKVGDVKYKSDFDFKYGCGAHHFYNARIMYENEKWILKFSLKGESQTQELTDISMGIDLGVKDLAIVEFDGSKLVFQNINKSKKMRDIKQKIRRLQRSISRKYEVNKKGNVYVKTKNIAKQEQKLRKLYAKQSNIRKDYLHKTTHSLVSLLPRRVVMEDLNVAGMMKNKYIADAVREQCFYIFEWYMEYKCNARGTEFIKADRFFPSSKTCSCCGHVKKDLTLKDRTYICDECGAVIDRDYNAAINLSRYVA